MTTMEIRKAPTVVHSPSEPLEDTWITVFGFPSSATSYILQQFKAYGDIFQYEIGDNNWIHIQYATKLQAQKALARNGHLFGDSLLVGVVPFRKVSGNRRVVGVDLEVDWVKEEDDINIGSLLCLAIVILKVGSFIRPGLCGR